MKPTNDHLDKVFGALKRARAATTEAETRLRIVEQERNLVKSMADTEREQSQRIQRALIALIDGTGEVESGGAKGQDEILVAIRATDPSKALEKIRIPVLPAGADSIKDDSLKLSA